MSVAVITGSAGLVGSEAAANFAGCGMEIAGIDCDMRRRFFGDAASTAWQRRRLERSLGAAYTHFDTDIRDTDAIEAVFGRYRANVSVVVHAAAQPSHDWAAREPRTDYTVNALGTLNLLEAARRFAPDAAFVFLSTNKVYGDTPNRLPLVETETRWEIAGDHPYAGGIGEDMSIDSSLHSLFGASKAGADLLVQEYGRYFGMKTACLRAGCLTGPNHAGAELHGFLAFLMQCAVTGRPYTVFGHGAKQVRDNLHAADLARAIGAIVEAPRSGEVYNIGGGRHSNCSMLEAIRLCEEIAGREMAWSYSDEARAGDHIWWISDLARFRAHYPAWRQEYDVPAILREIYEQNAGRWRESAAG